MWIAGLILMTSFLQHCKPPEDPPNGATYLELNINANQLYQEFYGFGASDAWSCQFVGKNWPLEKREQIADWLFSKELDEDKNPKGIGLDIWRFNIGAGSASQGVGSGIQDEWRRAESFLTQAGEFEPAGQLGQRWFLKAAKERGVDQFIAFSNSPPVNFTKNGKAYSSNSSSYNLKTEFYKEFASFLADVVQYLAAEDEIDVDYLSPFNEPQWDWTSGGQEGSPAQNEEIYNFSVCLTQF
jgi:O-glycosyl hydrolase